MDPCIYYSVRYFGKHCIVNKILTFENGKCCEHDFCRVTADKIHKFLKQFTQSRPSENKKSSLALSFFPLG